MSLNRSTRWERRRLGQGRTADGPGPQRPLQPEDPRCFQSLPYRCDRCARGPVAVRTRSPAFALFELLVVTVIIALLAALLLPALSEAKGTAQSIRCTCHLKRVMGELAQAVVRPLPPLATRLAKGAFLA